MISKTTQFDEALNQIFGNTEPHDRACGQCGALFRIFQEDINFYHLLYVPPPKLCPSCRRQRRLLFLNYSTFYKRPCNVPGHGESIISSYPPDADYPVYDFAFWWSDQFDIAAFQHVYEPKKKFFDQFANLAKQVPVAATTRDPASVNSDYTLYGWQLKSCYYVFGGLLSENVLYSNWPMQSKECMDILITLNCEHCYEGVFLTNCYNCNFSYFCDDCMDSDFLYDCKDCRHCFGCTNLRHKKFCFFNEQLSEQEYKKRRVAIELGDRKILEEHKERFSKLIKRYPVRGVYNKRVQNVVGNYLVDCKDSFMVSWVVGSENLRYGELTKKMKDSMDFTLSTESERLYEIVNAGHCSDVKFSVLSPMCLSSEYCMFCYNCEYCFGCVGLRNKKYHILNTPYTEEQYWQKLDGLKAAMLRDGEYGEFFPPSFSHYPYNASLAQMVFPLSSEGATALGARWHEKPAVMVENEQTLLRAPGEIPNRIENVPDAIINSVILSGRSKKPYRLIKEELEFYRKKGLALPTIHPDERMGDRFKIVNYFRITETMCVKCGKATRSAYDAKDGFTIYCEQCYNAEVV